MSVPCVENVTAPAVESDEDAQRIAQLRDRHWTMLWLSAAIMICALSLQTDPSGRVGPTWLSNVKLPEMCGSRALLGIQCPGCGLTRSFIALAHGDLAGSLAYNRVGWLLALAVLLQFPYRIFALRELRTGVVERKWKSWFGWALIVALVSNWLLKLAGLI